MRDVSMNLTVLCIVSLSLYANSNSIVYIIDSILQNNQ